MEHYLDNSATTKVCPEAAEAALFAMTECYGNPSSTHTKGREAKKLLDKSRKQVAAALGCAESELAFTSCGSESDNWAILSAAEAMHRQGRHIISSAVEHDAVRKSMEELSRRGFEISLIQPNESGAVSAEAVERELRDDTILVSLMLVNNETGAVTDISSISKLLRARGSKALLHTDAVQGFMKLPFTPKSLGADMISISGHKIHAPKGVGALYIRQGLKLKPYIMGGSQESGRRAGTEAMPQIAAFGEACRVANSALSENIAYMSRLKALATEQLSSRIPELVLIEGDAPHVLSISMPGWRSEVLMNYLEARQIYVSRSSACKKGGRSHVLEAMKLPPKVIDGAIRIGLCRYNTEEDIYALAAALGEARETISHR